MRQRNEQTGDAGDDRWMELARRAGLRHSGLTAENPAVGCVIVKNGNLAGIGWTALGGRPHGEPLALAMAGKAARGSTAYVTLEPCCHEGRAPPCTKALIEAGVGRVVIGLKDPDRRVAGAGMAQLRQAGIAVETVPDGELKQRIRRDLAGFFSRIERNRPHLFLKLAMSRDHRIAKRAGAPTQITGAKVKARVHLLRAQSDAILVGVSTVKADDPSLTCRLPGMGAASPIRVVSDSNLTMPPDCRLLQTLKEVPLWILTTRPDDHQDAKRLGDKGAEIITCAATSDGKVDLHDAMAKLATRGINRIMAEGGAHMAKALLEAGLVDEAILFEAPIELGETALHALAGEPLEIITAGEKFTLSETEMLGEDEMRVYTRCRA